MFRELTGEIWQGKKGVSILMSELMTNFLPAMGCRKILRLPLASQLDNVKMSGTCICHGEVVQFSYAFACSQCLALHCKRYMFDQLKEIEQEGKRVDKAKKNNGPVDPN